MEYTEIITEAISTLSVNKLRTGLATLGIVIGIGSVIALVSLGQAGQRSIEQQIKTLGSNLLTVSPGAQRSGGIRGAAGGGQSLTYDDAKAIISSPQITTVKKVSPEYSGREQIVAGGNNRHRLNDPAQADFSILSQADIVGIATEVTSTFTTLLSGIAAISLIVGGIGIMNIMLVTVTERTREIGLRKALGAKKKVVNTQFLLEAVMVTFVGGLIGIVLGVIVAYLLSRSMRLPFVLSPSSILLAFGVSAVIGVLFGWYPAQKAANLQPIEALRYE